jgi:environmental stress-induced protein Ves
LTAQSPPLEFAGDAVMSGGVEGDAALDLNLMWQPALWHATLTRLTATAGASQLQRLTGICMVCSLTEALQLRCGETMYTLGRYDLLVLEPRRSPESSAEVTALEASGFDAYCIELRPR